MLTFSVIVIVVHQNQFLLIFIFGGDLTFQSNFWRTARYWKRELDSRKFINPIETRFFNVSLLNFDEKAKKKLKQK